MATSNPSNPNRVAVLVEVRGLNEPSPGGSARFIKKLRVSGCTVDPEQEPVPMGGGSTHIIRCLVPGEDAIEKLRRRPEVAAVWNDTEIAPMT